MGGPNPSRLHLVEHQSGLDANQKRQRIAQDTGGWISHPDPKHWLGNSSMGGGKLGSTSQTSTKRTSGRQAEQDGHRTGGIVGSPSSRGVINSRWLQTPRDWLAPTRIRGQANPRFRIPMQWMQDRANWESQAENNYGVWNEAGFLKAHRLTA